MRRAWFGGVLAVCLIAGCGAPDFVAAQGHPQAAIERHRAGSDGSTTPGGPTPIAATRAAVPRAVTVARTTKIPACTLFVDAAATAPGNGTVAKPFTTLAAAVAAANAGAVICVAEGVYAEMLTPGTKPFTLAGGFQSGEAFTVRDSAEYVSRAEGSGGSFVRIEDTGPTGDELTAIDGFEITGYSQAIVRDFFVSQRFDITNNFIHDNSCSEPGLSGAGFSLSNVSGTIKGNVFARNACGRGGAGALIDPTNENSVLIANNLIAENAGTEPVSSHGGGLYLFTNKLKITANHFVDNTVTGWGAGLFVGAFTAGGEFTTAKMSWNVYQDNRAGIAGGGSFCDDSARCRSDHEIYYRNCGGNIYLDGGPVGSGPTIATFDHLTNVGALAVGCDGPGAGVQIDKDNDSPDAYAFTNAIFWGNAPKRDFAAACGSGCDAVSVVVDYSMVQTRYADGGIEIDFGPGIVRPANPLFVSLKKGDFHLKSVFGHFTPDGYVRDAATSPALAKGDPDGSTAKNPKRAGKRTELGAYGNSAEASYVK
jgi:hypothetical protein